MIINGKLAPFYAPGEVPEYSCLRCENYRFERHCDYYKDGQCKQDGSDPVQFVESLDWLKRLCDAHRLASGEKRWLFTAKDVNSFMEKIYGR